MIKNVPISKMKLRVRDVDIETGGPLVAILNEKDAIKRMVAK